jgi:hypothetical protein
MQHRFKQQLEPCISLAAYRTDVEVVQATLRCEMPMKQELMRQWMSRVKPYSMLEAVVVGLTDSNVALISNLEIKDEADPDLMQIKEALQTPVIFHSPKFGTLTLDRRFGQYEGNAQWCGGPVRLSLICSDIANPAITVSAAESLFKNQEMWDERVREFTADRLLTLKNESWLGDDEEELSRVVFISRVTLQEITVDENGDFDFWLDDGDLFWGHTILVNGNIDRGLSDAGIHG